jgi:hypothetical protein
MPPLVEIELVNSERMLIRKLKVFKKLEDLKSILGEEIIKLLEKLSHHEFNLENEDFLGMLKDLERKILDRELFNIEDRERIISYYLELLGYATSSAYSQNYSLESGKIGLCLKSIKKVEHYITNHKEFLDYQSYIAKCYLYEFENKSFAYLDLLEKVYYHEFGHLFFGHTKNKSNHVDNPNKTQESYANFFASLIYNSQNKSFLIWFLTRFQPDEYKEPILLHIHPDINEIDPKKYNQGKLDQFNLQRMIKDEKEKRQSSLKGIHE